MYTANKLILATSMPSSRQADVLLHSSAPTSSRHATMRRLRIAGFNVHDEQTLNVHGLQDFIVHDRFVSRRRELTIAN